MTKWQEQCNRPRYQFTLNCCNTEDLLIQPEYICIYVCMSKLFRLRIVRQVNTRFRVCSSIDRVLCYVLWSIVCTHSVNYSSYCPHRDCNKLFALFIFSLYLFISAISICMLYILLVKRNQIIDETS